MRKLLIAVSLIFAVVVGYKFMKPERCFATFTLCPTVEKTSQIAPGYLWYTQQNFEAVARGNDKIVLFFYAPWCGTCSVLDDELVRHPDRLGDGITVLKVEYDKDRVMKQKYGIVTQHTLVYVDHSGKELKKWVGGDIAQLRTFIGN